MARQGSAACRRRSRPGWSHSCTSSIRRRSRTACPLRDSSRAGRRCTEVACCCLQQHPDQYPGRYIGTWKSSSCGEGERRVEGGGRRVEDGGRRTEEQNKMSGEKPGKKLSRQGPAGPGSGGATGRRCLVVASQGLGGWPADCTSGAQRASNPRRGRGKFFYTHRSRAQDRRNTRVGTPPRS